MCEQQMMVKIKSDDPRDRRDMYGSDECAKMKAYATAGRAVLESLR